MYLMRLKVSHQKSKTKKRKKKQRKRKKAKQNANAGVDNTDLNSRNKVQNYKSSVERYSPVRGIEPRAPRMFDLEGS